MKTFLLFILPFVNLAQMPLDEQTHKFTYTEVVEVSGMSKDQLYVAARSWYVNAYRSADDVIQMEDKETGKIIGKGNFKVDFQSSARTVHHTLQIDVKDGRYRFIITDFLLKFSSAYSEMPMETINKSQFWGLSKLYERTDSQVKQIIASLKAEMKKAATSSDDW